LNWYKIAQVAGWQEGWDETLGDIQRYIYDAYTARVFITKLASEKITVSVSLYHMQNGTCMWQDFWRFKTNESAKAKACYNKVKQATEKVIQTFKTNDIPNPMIHSYLREECRFISPESKPTSRIPHVDWAREQKGVEDWRNSIYGTRYPMPDGF
jgi:hypothetical protein